jgi:hypothetical protein
MFTREMMIANLNGTKWQTRRPLKIKNLEFLAPHGDDENDPSNWGYLDEYGEAVTLDTMLPAQPGDIMCARETMRVVKVGFIGAFVKLKYEADGHETELVDWPSRLKEKPTVGKCLSNGGPREFWRFKRPLTGVRIERIQSISEADAIAEGVERDHEVPINPIDTFRDLWDSTYPGSWGRNDWVIVYEYERQAKP